MVGRFSGIGFIQFKFSFFFGGFFSMLFVHFEIAVKLRFICLEVVLHRGKLVQMVKICCL